MISFRGRGNSYGGRGGGGVGCRGRGGRCSRGGSRGGFNTTYDHSSFDYTSLYSETDEQFDEGNEEIETNVQIDNLKTEQVLEPAKSLQLQRILTRGSTQKRGVVKRGRGLGVTRGRGTFTRGGSGISFVERGGRGLRRGGRGRGSDRLSAGDWRGRGKN